MKNYLCAIQACRETGSIILSQPVFVCLYIAIVIFTVYHKLIKTQQAHN